MSVAAKQQLNKEVIMAHSAYARAAGLQSEVNKITVTRVAGNEVEYHRQLNLYRKDMMIKINNIRREEKRLKKSMIRYHRKKRQNHIDKKQRQKEDEERDRKAMENITNVIQIHVTPEVQGPPEVKEGSPDSGLGEDISRITQQEHCADVSMELSNNEGSNQEKETKTAKGTVHNTVPLPVIQEDMEEQESVHEDDSASKDNENVSQLRSCDEENSQGEQDSSTRTLPSLLLRFQKRPLKTKKQVVSFADLIKLQHSTNTKKLFNLVHLLADKHGVKDIQKIDEKENRNTVVLRGSTDEPMSDSIMRAASVLYPMKFGYMGNTELPPIEKSNSITSPTDVSSSENSGKATPEFKSSRSPRLQNSHSEPNSSRARTYSRQTEPSQLVSSRDNEPVSPRYLKKRNNSMPAIVAEVEKIQKENLQKITADVNKEKMDKIVSRSMPSAPRTLKPLEKRLSTGDIFPKKSNIVSWTEAFGLLKVVHSLND